VSDSEEPEEPAAEVDLPEDATAADGEQEVLQPEVVGEQRPRTDRLAIGAAAAGVAAFLFVGSILTFVLVPAAVYMGVRALRRIQASGDTIPGKRFAQAGIAAAAVATIVFAVLYVTFQWEKEGPEAPTPKESSAPE
jgi:hypothetical protein